MELADKGRPEGTLVAKWWSIAAWEFFDACYRRPL